MNWIIVCRTLLDQPFQPSCPAFELATQQVGEQQFLSAAQSLSALDGMQRFFAGFVIELQAVESGIDDTTLQQMCAGMNAMPTNSVMSSDLPHIMLKTWTCKVGIRLPVSALLERDKFTYGQTLLDFCITEFCRLGEWGKAFDFATRLNPYFREKVARLWAAIGLGMPAGPAKDQALMSAAKAGNERPKIQDGGEEANAHGQAIRAFALGGLAHDHPAVVVAFKGMLKLANSMAQKSAPAWGTQQAIIGACLRAANTLDENWRNIAAELQRTVWGSSLDAAGKAAVLLADLKLGRVAAQPQTDSEEVLRSKADFKWHAAESPEEIARLNEEGHDVRQQIEKHLDEWDGYGRKSVKRFVKACRLRLPTERLEALLAECPEAEKSEAMVEGAAYGLTHDPRRLAYLERGYPQGDEYGIYTDQLLPLLSAEKIREAEEFFGAKGRINALGDLAAWHLHHGHLAEAAATIARFMQPVSDKDPWVPRYRRGEAGRVIVPAVVNPMEIDVLIKAAEHAFALLTLAKGLQPEPEALAKVFQAGRLKKWEKPDQAAALITLRLMESDFFAALELLPLISDGRKKGDALRELACHLLLNTVGLNIDAAQKVSKLFLETLGGLHPQWAFRAIKFVAEVLISKMPPSNQAEIVEQLLQIARKLYRCAGDHALLYSGLSRGFYAIGQISEAIEWAQKALSTASEPVIYLYASWIGNDIAKMKAQFPQAIWQTMIQRAFEVAVLHREKDYDQLEELEIILLELWNHGDVEQGNLVLLNPNISQSVRQDLRRTIWADIGRSPDPLGSLEGSWPKEALPKDVLKELMNAVVTSLERVAHPDAKAVREMLGN